MKCFKEKIRISNSWAVAEKIKKKKKNSLFLSSLFSSITTISRGMMRCLKENLHISNSCDVSNSRTATEKEKRTKEKERENSLCFSLYSYNFKVLDEIPQKDQSLKRLTRFTSFVGDFLGAKSQYFLCKINKIQTRRGHCAWLVN